MKISSLTKNIRLPGLLYLLLAVTGFFTRFSLDGFSIQFFGSWLQYIENNQSLYRIGLLSYASMDLVWILLAWSLYNCFREVDKGTVGVLVIFVMLGSGMDFTLLMVRTIPLVVISLKGLLSTELFMSWMEWAHFLFMMGGKMHKVVNLFYALWLFPLALLYYRWTEYRKVSIILTGALLICGWGYLGDFVLFYLFPDRVVLELISFTFIGEVFLLAWLLIKGQKRIKGSKEIERH